MSTHSITFHCSEIIECTCREQYRDRGHAFLRGLLDHIAVHLSQDLEEQAEWIREVDDLSLVDAADRHVRVLWDR
jgi:hypothetical protein